MHSEFLLAALDEAKRGLGSCAPNPAVGAVAVQNNAIIAKAWHRGAGTPHAEQLLLNQLPKGLADLTLYVTLEPCNHWGRTPPCVDAIIKYGIKTVVYAYRDPNPLVIANDTPALLNKHGIEVIYHPVNNIDSFYQSYRYWTVTGLPWVTAKIAQSLDSKIAGEQGTRLHLSNEACAHFTHTKRLQSDIILTTARTIHQDNPLLNVRMPAGHSSKPVAIIDRCGRLASDSKVLKTARCCHIFHDEQVAIEHKLSNCTYHAISSNNNRLDLHAIIARLGSLGFHKVWVEAGGTLFNALHQSKLVNKTYLYIAPIVIGPLSTSIYSCADIFTGPHTISLQAMDDNMVISFQWQNESQETPCSQV